MSALSSLEVSVCLLACEILPGLECVCVWNVFCVVFFLVLVSLLHDFYPLTG